MSGNRRLLILAGIVLLILLGLGGLYLWLFGGGASDSEIEDPNKGLIPIRSIYTYADGDPVAIPNGIGADETGNFFVTLRDSARIVEFDSDGDYVRHWGERGVEPGQLLAPMDVAVDRLADHVYVVDRARLRLICYDGAGNYLWEVPLLGPLAIHVDANGDIFVSTFGPMVKFTSEGQFIAQVGTRGSAPGQFDFPRSAVMNDEGTVFVADTNNARVQRIEFEGESTATVSWVLGRRPRVQDEQGLRFTAPSGIELDERGRVILLDGFKHVIEMLDPDTNATLTDFGGERRGPTDGTFNLPTQIERLYDDYYAVTDTYNDRVQIIRLLGPDERSFLDIYPWLKWLLLLPLLLLLALFGRKRVFLTQESLQRTVDEGDFRLFAGVFKRMYVLPEVFDEFKETYEGDVRLGDHLVAAQLPKEEQAARTTSEASEVAGAEGVAGMLNDEERLAAVAQRSRLERIMLARHRVIGADEDQCMRLDDLELVVLPYDQITEEYAIEGEGAADQA